MIRVSGNFADPGSFDRDRLICTNFAESADIFGFFRKMPKKMAGFSQLAGGQDCELPVAKVRLELLDCFPC
jgi:hypothetical protein